MSEQAEWLEDDENGPEIDAEAQTDPAEGDDTADAPRGGREARYRVQRNEAREERNALAARLEELQTRELHRLAADYLAAPEDLSLSGKTLADYLTPEGWVDHEAVEAAANELIKSRPGLAKVEPIRAIDRSQGLGNSVDHQPTWSALLQDI